MVTFVPTGGHLDRTTREDGEPGLAGHGKEASLVRAFTPEPGRSLDDLVAAFDAEARSHDLTVTTHQRGHCAVTSVDDGTVVYTWRSLPDRGEVLFRATLRSPDTDQEQGCRFGAGPPTG